MLIIKDLNEGDRINNFRLISLLNREVKILAKLLAKRLAHVASSLIGVAQTCAVLGRSIQDNLHLMRYTLEGPDDISGTGGVLVHLDQANVFDKVDHWYLVLALMWLGLVLASLGGSMYDNIDSIAWVNSFLSELVCIKHLVYQECLFFPLLYVMALELLLRKVSSIPRGPSCGHYHHHD